MCVRDIDIASVSVIFLLDFRLCWLFLVLLVFRFIE